MILDPPNLLLIKPMKSTKNHQLKAPKCHLPNWPRSSESSQRALIIIIPFIHVLLAPTTKHRIFHDPQLFPAPTKKTWEFLLQKYQIQFPAVQSSASGIVACRGAWKRPPGWCDYHRYPPIYRWWFQPIWKILVKFNHFPCRGKNNQIFETTHLDFALVRDWIPARFFVEEFRCFEDSFMALFQWMGDSMQSRSHGDRYLFQFLWKNKTCHTAWGATFGDR